MWKADALSPLAAAWPSPTVAVLAQPGRCWQRLPGASGLTVLGQGRGRAAVASQGHAAVMPSLLVQCPPASASDLNLPAVGMGEEWCDTPAKIHRRVGFPGNARTTAGRMGKIVRFDQGKFETYHLTCMVCGALPGTTCIDEDYQELPQVHPSRRMGIGERNWRFRQGWEPPELVEQRRKRRAEERARAALFNPRLGPETKAVRKALRRAGLAVS